MYQLWSKISSSFNRLHENLILLIICPNVLVAQAFFIDGRNKLYAEADFNIFFDSYSTLWYFFFLSFSVLAKHKKLISRAAYLSC